jgi:hypothetical protein
MQPHSDIRANGLRGEAQSKGDIRIEFNLEKSLPDSTHWLGQAGDHHLLARHRCEMPRRYRRIDSKLQKRVSLHAVGQRFHNGSLTSFLSPDLSGPACGTLFFVGLSGRNCAYTQDLGEDEAIN